MYFFKRCWILLAFSTVMSADGAPLTVSEELRRIIVEKGFFQGVDRKTRSIVEIGVSQSREEPELVARTLAAWRISCRLNGGELSAMRTAVQCDGGLKFLSVIEKVSDGYISGVQEVARVTRRNKNGRLTVGVALRWTLKQEHEAMESISVSRGEECAFAEVVGNMPFLVRMGGPQFWLDNDTKRSSYLLGVGVCKIKTSDKAGVRSAVRLAQIRARRYLSFHFCQYHKGREAFEFVADDDGYGKNLDSLHIVKQKGVIAPGMGAANIYENIITEDGQCYAVCVTCLLKD